MPITQMSVGGTALVVAVLAAVTSASRAQILPARSGPPHLGIATDHSTRLLVVAAHPDDETLGAGGLIRRVTAQGGAVRVVWMTSGDGFPEGVETAEGVTHPTPQDYRSYGGLREFEARAAMASLGVDRQSLTFLGFPDEGLCELASTYLSAKMQVFRSPYTGRISPPFTERVIRGVRTAVAMYAANLSVCSSSFHRMSSSFPTLKTPILITAQRTSSSAKRSMRWQHEAARGRASSTT